MYSSRTGWHTFLSSRLEENEGVYEGLSIAPAGSKYEGKLIEHGLLHNVPLDKVADFEHSFLETLEMNHREDILDILKKGIIDDEISGKIEDVANKVARQFLS